MTPCSGSCRAGLSDRPGPIPELPLPCQPRPPFFGAVPAHCVARCPQRVPPLAEAWGTKSTARGSPFLSFFSSTVTDATCQEDCYNRLPNRARVVPSRPGSRARRLRNRGCNSGRAREEGSRRSGFEAEAGRSLNGSRIRASRPRRATTLGRGGECWKASAESA